MIQNISCIPNVDDKILIEGDRYKVTKVRSKYEARTNGQHGLANSMWAYHCIAELTVSKGKVRRFVMQNERGGFQFVPVPVSSNDKHRPAPIIREQFASFMQSVQEIGDCWLWQAETDKDGFGRFRLGGRRVAHRWMWEYHTKQQPHGFQIFHTCGNKTCVNPQHLVSSKEAVQ